MAAKTVAFQKRLAAAKERAGLTLKDMAVWLGDVPWQTVSTWLSGRVPKEYRLVRLERALGLLEKELDSRKSAFPIPLGVKEGERGDYVRKIRGKYPAA